jgi:hypothetical protein
MTEDTRSEGGSDGRRLKLVRLIDEYALDDLGAELEQQWTADPDERSSLRELADYVNRELLAAALRDAGVEPLTSEIETLYSVLTAEGSDAERTRIRRRLQRDDVDVEQLERDFVTYQAVRAYLKDHRGVEYSPTEPGTTDGDVESVRRLRGRLSAVLESKVEKLQSTDAVTIGDYRTIVTTRIVCEECGGRYEFDELVERGGCDCVERPN